MQHSSPDKRATSLQTVARSLRVLSLTSLELIARYPESGDLRFKITIRPKSSVCSKQKQQVLKLLAKQVQPFGRALRLNNVLIIIFLI